MLDPAVTALTTPDPLTVTIDGALLVHCVGVQAWVVASEYVAVASSCSVLPVTSVLEAGESATAVMVGAAGADGAVGCVGVGGCTASGATTTGAGELVRPLQLAVTFAVPPARAVTSPELLTVATAGALLLQLLVHAWLELSDSTAMACSC